MEVGTGGWGNSGGGWSPTNSFEDIAENQCSVRELFCRGQSRASSKAVSEGHVVEGGFTESL